MKNIKKLSNNGPKTVSFKRSTNAFWCIVFSFIVLCYLIKIQLSFRGEDADEWRKFISTAKLPNVEHKLEEKVLSTANEVKAPLRLLFMTASYSFDQFLPLQKTLDCMRDICNSGWNVTVLLQTASGLNYSHPKYAELQSRLFCVRSGTFVSLEIQEFNKIGFGLNSQHRKYMSRRLLDFDYFSYAEEDMQLTASHLAAYLSAQNVLATHLGRELSLRYCIGFIRYEDSVVGGVERVTWEYLPHQVHVVDMAATPFLDNATASEPTDPTSSLGKYVVTNNLNQAIYVFPREQVQHLEDRCAFLSDPGRNRFYNELRRAQNKDWKFMAVGVSEWSSSFQQVLQCGLRRVIPVEHFQLFMIHHASNIAQKRRLRKELLTVRLWSSLLQNLSLSPITMEQAYGARGIIAQQYNLHLMDTVSLDAQNVKWAYAQD